MASSHLYLGIDGGQSHTSAVIGDAGGRVVARASGPGCNRQDAFEPVLRDTVATALRLLGRDRRSTPFAAVCLGLSGGGGPEREAAVRRLIHSSRIQLTTDAEVAIDAAFEEGVGVVVLAGTGAITYGRNSAGETARSGGWGYAFGDEGGAFDLVRRTLRAALATEEAHRPATLLQRLLVNRAGAASANELMHRWYAEGLPVEKVASFAPLVGEAAAGGDPEAWRILEESATKLAAAATRVRAQLFVEASAVLVSFFGGVFKSREFRGQLAAQLEAQSGWIVAQPKRELGEGALVRAYRLAGTAARPVL